jgi:hypothetical protein
MKVSENLGRAALLLANLLTVLAMASRVWLYSRRHHISGPQQIGVIGHVMLLTFAASCCGLVLVSSWLVLRRRSSKASMESLSKEDLWGRLSFLVALLVFILGVIPVQHG